MINAGGGVEKREPPALLVECMLVQPLRRSVWRHLRNLYIELPYNPAIPLLGISQDKTFLKKDAYTPMFIGALFTIGKTWRHGNNLNVH